MRIIEKNSGYTLLEALIVIGIISVISSLSIASYSTIQRKLNHKAQSDHIENFLHHSRNQAITLGQDIYVSITPSGSCLGASVVENCDCSVSDSCQVDDQYLRITLDDKQFSITDLSLAQPNTLKFNAYLGISAGHNGSFTLDSGVAKTRLIVSALGRTRHCLTQGSISGFTSC